MTGRTRLSICIATFRRADYLGETLRSILTRCPAGVDLLVVDGASPDATSAVMAQVVADHPQVRYFRENSNSGVDRDYDKAVRYARGDYCWLMTDDDLLAPGAVERVLGLLEQEPSLLIVDGVVENVDMTRILRPHRMKFTGLRRYSPSDRDALLIDIGEAISFIGAVVIRRDIWLARDHASYAGSLFAHVGVILQAPMPGVVLALGEPLVRIRLGNAMWTPRRFEIWAFKWPDLIWAMDGYSDVAKRTLGPRELWRSPKHLFSFRAKGAYSYVSYRHHFGDKRLGAWRLAMLAIALLPGRAAHVLGILYLRLTGEATGMGAYDLLHSSPFTNALSRWIARR